MATENDSASHAAGKPAPIPCTVLRGDPLNGLLAVDSEGARVALDLQVAGGRCVYLIFEQDTAIDLRASYGHRDGPAPGRYCLNSPIRGVHSGAPIVLVSTTPEPAWPKHP